MKQFLTSFLHFAPDNGSGMHRLWTDNGPMKSRKLFALLFCLLFVGVGNAWGTVTSTYTFSTADNGKTITNNSVQWGLGASSVATNGTSLYLGGTITITMPTGAYLYSAKINKSSNWAAANKVTVLLKSGSTTLHTYSVSNYSSAFTLTSNQTDGSYTIEKGLTAKNAWITSIQLVYYPQTVVTLDKNGGDDDGQAKCTYNATSCSSFTAATRAGYTCTGYYTATSAGTKVLNADGSKASTSVSGWWSSSKWCKDAASATLYAQWESAAPACADPTAPTNGSVSGTGVTISTTSAAANYDIYLSTSATTPTTQDPTATISSGNSKAITGLSYGTTYYYWMRQNCGGGSSSWVAGSPTSFTTTVPDPSGVSAGSLTMDGATFTITDDNNVNNYDIYYSTSSTAPVAGTAATTTSTSKTKAVSGLAAGTYYYWVRAKGPNAKSDWVGGSTFTTLTLSSISVSTAPTKTKYLVGDNFDPTALVITRTYSNSTSDTYSYAGHTSEFTFSPATNAALTAENTSVTISYGGKSTSQAINVYSVTVNKVDMDGNAIADAGVTASCSGRTLSQSVSTTNYKFNSWVLATASGTSLSTNTLTGTPTGNVVVNAKFHKPITVTWKVGSGAASGSPTTEVKYNTAITALPSTPADNALASCGTNKFMGWTALGELKGTGNDAPADLFTTVGGATALTENTTYRAVFASSTSGAAANTVLFEEPFTGMTADTKPTAPGSSATVYGSATITYTFTDGTGTSSGTTAIKNEALTYSGSAPEVLVGKKGTSSGAAGGKVVISGIPNGGASALTVSYTQNANGLSATASGTGYSGSTSGSSKTDKSFDVTVSSNADATLTLTFQATSTSNVRLDDIKVKVKTAGTTAVDYQTGCCSAPGTALSITSANSVATGGTVSLTSTGGNGGTVTWSVVNGTGTASVAGTTLTAGSVGTVTVKAHQDATGSYCAQDAEQAFTVVSSTINVTGVEVSPTTKAIVPGETFDITPTISPSNATDKSVSWTSSASDKASVSSGTVTGVAAGTATITCTTTDGSYTATTAVTVYGVTMQALDEDGNAIAVGGPGTPSRTGASISPAADAGNYVFKEWAISGASLGSSASTKANTITNPTGAVTVTAKYYKPRTVKWSVNGNDSYNTGSPTTTVAYNGTITTVPSDPSGLACASTFVAWTDAAHNNGQTAKDDDSYYESKLFTDAGDFPNITAETTTFYAVFAEKTNSDGYKYIGDDGTLADGKKYIFVNAKSAGSAYALKATDLAAPNSGNNGTAVSVTVTSNAEGVLVTTVNTNLEFEYVSSGTKLKYEVDGPATRYLFINGDGVGMKSDDSRSRYTTDAGLQGWNNKVTSYYDVYYNSTNEKFEREESAGSRVYAFIKQTATYGNYVTECDANIVSVTYDANGGATSCANTTTDKTEDFTVCSSAPTRDYYTFAGWLCSADDEVYAASATIDDAVIDADFTLTAQWNPVTYTITYNYNGGSAQVDPVPATSYTVESSDITLQTPTKGHDRFDGWYENADLSTGGVKTTIAAGSHENKTYYAKWTARHEIIFDADGATTTIYRADDENMEDAVAGQGSVPSDPDAPTACSSKVFVGWSESTIDGETDTEPGDLMKPAAGMVDEDKHYYAVWATATPASIPATYAGTGVFQQITSMSQLETGTYYVLRGVNGSTKKAMGNTVSSGKMGAVADPLSDGKITNPGVAIVWKLDGTKDAYTLYNQNASKYVEITSNSTGGYELKTDASTSYTVTVEDGHGFFFKSNHASANLRGISIYNASEFRSYILSDAKTLELYKMPKTIYTAYSTSCCATKIVLSDPSITDASSSGSTITFDKSSPVYTCGGTKTVTATLTLTAGYQASALSFAVNSGTVSISPAISTPITSSQVYTLTFAEDQNATLTTTATIAAKPLNGITITPSSGEVYVGQYVDFTVSYDPADYISPGYTLNATPVYVTKESAAPANTKLRLKGGRGSGPGASITETVNETVTIKASGDNTKTASVNMTVNPLPRVHFEDLVHGKEFADVVATIAENALNPNKTTKTSVDWVTPNANSCEENHLHLVGWIREDWPALVAYLNGTGAAPTTVAITGAGNDSEGHAYYIAAGASINVQTFDGVTFYAVWAEIK